VIRGVGKSMRMKRVIDHAGASVICALDHGMTSPQFLEPLADIATRTAEAVAGGANVIMMSKGMIRLAEPAFAPTTSLALLLSASANPEQGEPEVVQIAEVEEAARLELQAGSDVLVVERVRTADGKPVVLSRDMLPGRLVAKQPHLADEMLKRSIYDVLERDLGIAIHHGVASFRPVRADVTVARRLNIPRGELLLAIWQVDFSDDGVPVLSSYEYHLADAFEFTVLRRGPGRRLS